MVVSRRMLGFGLLAIFCVCAPVPAQQPPALRPVSSDWENYYPLALGNAWVYREITPATGKTSQIRWEVTSEKQDNAGRRVFQIVPTPSDPADLWMELRLSKAGVQELSDGTWALKFPLQVDARWSSIQRSERHKRMVSRSFRVISVGRPCEAAGRSYRECVVIEEQNEESQLRIETLYAHGTGPVKSTYWPLNSQELAGRPVRIVELISFQVLPQQFPRPR